MCLIIAFISFALSLAFYTKDLHVQAIMSLSVALILFSVFVYRMIKYRHCIFSKDCKKGDSHGNRKI